MANYGTKYRYKYLAGDGQTVEVQVQQDGYSGSVTDLVPAPNGITVTWDEEGGDDLTEPLRISTATLRFIGDDAAEQLLDEVFDSPDQEYRVRHLVGGSLEWQGYLATDLRRYNPYTDSETVRLEALDGLALLEDQEQLDPLAGGDPLPDTLSLLLAKILRGLHDLDIYTSMDWHAYNADIGSGECPLDVYRVPGDAYEELDDQGRVEEVLDRRAQLEDLLERFGLRLTLAEGAWHLRQRDQTGDDGTIKRFRMGTSETSFDSASTDDISASLPPAARTERPVSGVQRLRSLASIYKYDDLGELVANDSFEDGLSPWTTTGTVDRVLYSNAGINEGATQEDQYLIKMDDGTVALPSGDEGSLIEQEVPAKLHDAGPKSSLEVQWDILDTVNSAGTTETRIKLGSYYVQARRIEVASDTNPAEDGELPLKSTIKDGIPDSATSDTIIAPKDARLRTGDASADDNPGDITLSEPARAGDDVLHGEISSQVKQGDYVLFFVWSDTTTTSFENTKEHYGLLNATLDYPTPLDSEVSFNAQQLRIPLTTPDGTDLTDKQPGFAVWSDNDDDSSETYHTWLDHVSMVQTVDGEPIEATTYIAVDDHYGQERKLTHRVGEGPTAEHPRRIHDASGNELLDDWKRLPYQDGVSPTGKGLEQLTAEQWMRQRRETLDRRTYDLEIRGETVSPIRIYQEASSAYTVEHLRRTWSTQGDEARIELVELKDAGLNGLETAYSMESDTSTGGAGSGSTIVSSQTVEGVQSWDELGGKPFSTIGNYLSVTSDALDVNLGDGLTGDGNDGITLDDDKIARTDVDESFDKDLTVLGSLFVEGDRVVQNVETLETEDNLLFTGKGAAGSGAASEWSGMGVDRGGADPFRFGFRESDDLFRVGKYYVRLQGTINNGSLSINERVVGQSSGAEADYYNDTLSYPGHFNYYFKNVTGSFEVGETIQAKSGDWAGTVDSVTVTDDTQAVATREDTPTGNALAYWNDTASRFDTDSSLKWDGSKLAIEDGEIVFTQADQNRLWRDDAFDAGLLSGDGVAAYQDANGRHVVEADVLRARDYIEALEFIVEEVQATGGSIVVSAGAIKVGSVAGSGPYTISSEDDHTLAEGDAIEAQRSGTNSHFSQLRVTGVASSTSVNATLESGDPPAAGMEYVVKGNDIDVDRQNVMLITSTINPSPRIEMFENSTGWDLAQADSTGQLGADTDGNMILKATKGRLDDSMTIGRVRREDQKVRAWDQPYSASGGGNFAKTIQTVIRPSDNKIHVGLVNGTDESSGVNYTVKVHISDPAGAVATFDTTNSNTDSPVWNGAGDNLSFSNGKQTATLSGSHSSGSDTFELVLDYISDDTEVEVEVTQWDVSSVFPETWAVTAGATVIDTHDSEDPTEWSADDPYRMYYRRSATSISGGTIVADTISAKELSISDVSDIDSDAAKLADVFSGDYNDLSGTPNLGDLASLSSITSTYIADGAVVTRTLAAGAVTANEISIGSVTDIDSDAAVISDVFSGDYSDLSGKPSLGDVASLNDIDSTYIADGAVVTRTIAAGSITANEISSNELLTEDFTIKNGGSITEGTDDWRLSDSYGLEFADDSSGTYIRWIDATDGFGSTPLAEISYTGGLILDTDGQLNVNAETNINLDPGYDHTVQIGSTAALDLNPTDAWIDFDIQWDPDNGDTPPAPPPGKVRVFADEKGQMRRLDENGNLGYF